MTWPLAIHGKATATTKDNHDVSVEGGVVNEVTCLAWQTVQRLQVELLGRGRHFRLTGVDVLRDSGHIV